MGEQLLHSEERGYIKGEILYTIFQNKEEHFTIAKLKIHDTNEPYKEKEIVGKGYFANLTEGTVYIFYGEFETHPKFGKQYNVLSYETSVPTTRDGLIAYLSSDMFYGIGKKTATKIIDSLGDDAVSSILDNPSIVDEIPGLNKTTGKKLVETLQENQGFERVVVYLSTYGIGLKMSQKIYEKYKESAIEVIESDPYQLVFDIEMFGFQKADQMAKKNGLPANHPSRIGAGCIFVLQQSILDGHVFLPENICISKVIHLLNTAGLDDTHIINRLEEMHEEGTVIWKENNIYLPSLYYAERNFTKNILRLLSKPVEPKTSLAELMKIIGDIEEKEILSYGEEQFEAIQEALDAKIMILTGGPGTGKTTVIKGLLHAYSSIYKIPYHIEDYENEEEYPFILTAPTGRAAKRMNESTGIPAYTIHRLLGWNGRDQFEKNEDEQLKGKILIVDEFSMVDIWLANHLFKAIPDDMQVILVGDEDQLPSVGPGQVLSDLLGSRALPYVTLKEVYRQKEGSKIIQLAHEIKNDQCTEQSLENDQDFSFIACNDNQIPDAIMNILQKAMEKGIDMFDVQVLVPMYRTQVGINELNKHLQALINPKGEGKREIKVNDVVYRVGDRVIQLINQPENGVYNGDIGEIAAIFYRNENKDEMEQIVIQYDQTEVVYEPKDYHTFMHAYCISIHKSQGSEFKIVLLPIASAYMRMLKKNLIYTAVTRAKQSLLICGSKNNFLKGIQTKDTNKRYTTLKERLLNNQAESEPIKEEDFSPYDFM